MAKTAIERLMGHIDIVDGPLKTPCWICTYKTRPDGYSQVADGRTRLAHRVAYEHTHGPIAPKMTIDHLCRVKTCVNPAHLEAVTSRVNWLRGNAPQAIAHRTNTCKRGHSLHDSYAEAGGGRRCKACHREVARRAMQKIRAARVAAGEDHPNR